MTDRSLAFCAFFLGLGYSLRAAALVALLAAGCAPTERRSWGGVTSAPSSRPAYCSACPHTILRAEVSCASCGKPMRHETRKNVGGRQ